MTKVIGQHTIRITGLKELGAPNAGKVRDEVVGSITQERNLIDLDLSETVYVDSAGLGALLAMHKEASRYGGRVRVLSPGLRVQQVLELTRLHLALEILPGGSAETEAAPSQTMDSPDQTSRPNRVHSPAGAR